MTIYIVYEQKAHYYVRRLDAEGVMRDFRKLTERQFQDYCRTAQQKGATIINLPEKPKKDLVAIVRKYS